MAAMLVFGLWSGVVEAQDCLAAPVTIARMHGDRRMEARELQLMTCDGRPNEAALDALSVLARPAGVEAPGDDDDGDGGRDAFVAPGIRRLDARLLTRLMAIAQRFEGHEIQIVSGYRPRARPTSRHRHGRALDLRVDGVPREEVADFAHGLEETGVGYYPNSTFTHVDVREQSYSWVDRSGPGQRADYGAWPPEPPADDVEGARRALALIGRQAAEQISRAAGAALSAATGTDAAAAAPADRPVADAEAVAPTDRPVADAAAPAEDGEHEPPPDDAELARLRAEWRSELATLAP